MPATFTFTQVHEMWKLVFHLKKKKYSLPLLSLLDQVLLCCQGCSMLLKWEGQFNTVWTFTACCMVKQFHLYNWNHFLGWKDLRKSSCSDSVISGLVRKRVLCRVHNKRMFLLHTMLTGNRIKSQIHWCFHYWNFSSKNSNGLSFSQ